MEFLLNGQSKTFGGDLELPLLTYLRETEGIISPKDGCAPQAACGCCAVDVNGKAVLACVTPMKKVEGAVVITTEGLGEYRQKVFANAFMEKGGVQCGFCIPGIVMQSNALINKNPDPTRGDVEQALTPHLCRCTGYKKIVDAVLYAADAIRNEEEIPTAHGNGKIGARLPKYQAQQLVLGQHRYVDDIQIEGMKFGALKFSDHPRARVLRLNTSEAEKLAGVIRIFTAADVPGERFIGLIKHDWPLMIAEGETTRYIGDVLAGVVAETEAIARAAVALIEVEYEVLEPITDMHEAMKPETPKVHESWPGAKSNILSTSVTNRGEVDTARTGSAYISRGVYQTQMIEHGYMEPECAVALPSPRSSEDELRPFPAGERGVEVLSQSQGIYDDREQICQLLALPREQVRVVMVPNGGGFGGKEDLSVQGHAALFAYHLQVPVKVRLTRDESILMHPKRHPIWMDYEVGCDEAGKLTFVKVKFVGDTGAYASVGMKVLERSAGHATGAYHVPVTDVEAIAVYTNNIPCGAMRGFGVNQAAFGLESCLDDLCEQGGFDRWQFRYDNALQNGDKTATGQVIESGAGVRETLLAVKEAFYAADADPHLHVGIACGIKNTGVGNGMPDESTARITITTPDRADEDIRIVIDHGWTEMGQGVNTVAVQVFCEETGLPPNLVEVRIDTAAEQIAGMTTASRATSLIGNALIDACKGLKADLETQLLEINACKGLPNPAQDAGSGDPAGAEGAIGESNLMEALGKLVGREYTGKWRVDWTTKPGAIADGYTRVEKVYTHYSYSYATQVVILDDEGQITKVIAAHDAGKIFNPTLFEGQLEGSIHMGLGYALTEELVLEGGRPKSTRLRQMGILRAKEMPEMEIIGVEVADPYGPYGAKGVGEIGLVPTAGAVANALYQFDGVRRRKLPMGRVGKRRK